MVADITDFIHTLVFLTEIRLNIVTLRLRQETAVEDVFTIFRG